MPKSFLNLLMKRLRIHHAQWPNVHLVGIPAPERGFFHGEMFGVPRRFRQELVMAIQQRGYELHMHKGTRCRLHMVSLVERSELFYREAIHKVYLWMSLVEEFRECSGGETNVYVYLLPDCKELPKERRGLGVEDVNTAFTRRCWPEINIFREEEWFKVLIHETFHNHGLDFARVWNAQACFPAVKSNVLLGESVCEFWANLLHTLLISFQQSGYRSFAHWEVMYDMECTFARVQCVKVLRHYGLTYADLLDARHTFDERESNAFAYYVVKCVMMHCGFMEWHIQANGSSLRFLETNVDGFCQWLRTSCRNEAFMRALREMEEVSLGNGVVGKTLRMVAF
jgi:hypothetical protein